MKISISFTIPDIFSPRKKFISRRPFQKSFVEKWIDRLWNMTPVRMKKTIITILSRKKVAEFVHLTMNFKSKHLLKWVYLLGYGIVYIIGTVAEWIWAIITFPLILFYRIFSSRVMSFFINITFIVLLLLGSWFYEDYAYTKVVLENAVAKLGGPEKLFCNEEDTITKLKESVVRIVGGEGEGSGFVYLSENGKSYILTNFHVIEYEVSPKVIIGRDNFRNAEIVAADKAMDIAVLRIEGERYPVEWGETSYLHMGEVLLSVGYALGSELTGEATFTRGSYNGVRNKSDTGLNYIHTNATIIGGMSGGVTTDVCGRVMGMNTYGSSDVGLAITAETLIEALNMFSDAEEPVKDIEIIEFKPEESPEEAVKAFYNYIRLGKYEKAYELVSPELMQGKTLDEVTEGYSSTLQTSIVSVMTDPDDPMIVYVKLHAVDLDGENFIDSYYEGSWKVEEIDGKYLLRSGNIQEVEYPDWTWFFSDVFFDEEIY